MAQLVTLFDLNFRKINLSAFILLHGLTAMVKLVVEDPWNEKNSALRLFEAKAGGVIGTTGVIAQGRENLQVTMKSLGNRSGKVQNVKPAIIKKLLHKHVIVV